MKTKLLFLLLSVIAVSCSHFSKNSYKVKCKIDGIEGGWAYLEKQGDGQWIKFDSAEISKGKFSFKGKLTSPEYCYLAIDGVDGTFGFFLENSLIRIKGNASSLDQSSISGSASQKEYDVYQKQLTSLNNETDDVYMLYKKAKKEDDQAKVYEYKARLNELDEKMTTALKDYISKNPKSIVSPYLLTTNFWRFELADLQKFKASFDPSLNISDYMKAIDKRIDILGKVTIGQTAPDFSMNDSTGKAVTLASYQGKIVMVDFWASWCPDCRLENPNIVALYKEYHPKGLEILGISLDRDRDNWIKAIKTDNLTWKHVSDLKDWDNSVARQYGVLSIPSNILVGKDGKIIGRNLYGDALKKKLAEIFKK